MVPPNFKPAAHHLNAETERTVQEVSLSARGKRCDPLSTFDYYRINELKLALHFGVGRTVACDVLLRPETLGLAD